MNNFYFAQLEEIERFGLTTLFVDFENLQDFSVEGEVGVLATAVATQYYRYNWHMNSLIQVPSVLDSRTPSIH